MKRSIFRAILLCALCLASSGGRAAVRKPPQEADVEKVVIRIDLGALRDSVDAQCLRDEEELTAFLDSTVEVSRQRDFALIDEFTGIDKTRIGGTYLGNLVVSLAKENLGKPYRWAADGPDRFDCSGLTRYVYKQIGINIPRHSGSQFEKGRKIEKLTELQEGDLVFFSGKKPHEVGHVGIVVSVDRELGRFSFIHASSNGGVKISSTNDPFYLQKYMGASRYIPAGK